MVFEQRLGAGARVPSRYVGKEPSTRGNSRCKGTEAGPFTGTEEGVAAMGEEERECEGSESGPDHTGFVEVGLYSECGRGHGRHLLGTWLLTASPVLACEERWDGTRCRAVGG